MTKGVLLFVNHNPAVDYILLAEHCAERVQQFLNLPVSIATNVHTNNSVFDSVIDTSKITHSSFSRRLRNGFSETYTIPFNNYTRTLAYNLTPYDKTLILDVDYLLANSLLLDCFTTDNDFLLYSNSCKIAKEDNDKEYVYLDDKGIEFYWATVIYFTKTRRVKMLFELAQHIQENYDYYRLLYGIRHGKTLRNDFVFSIAIHILNGFTKTAWPAEPPGKMLYIEDSDLVYKIDKDKFTFLMEKAHRPEDYTLAHTKGLNVHVMNKLGLIDRLKCYE